MQCGRDAGRRSGLGLGIGVARASNVLSRDCKDAIVLGTPNGVHAISPVRGRHR